MDDADIIFYDLDHDQDGKISFDDFSFGFRDFVTPGSRRGSIQLGLASPTKKTAPPSILAGGAIAEDRVLVLGEEEARKKQVWTWVPFVSMCRLQMSGRTRVDHILTYTLFYTLLYLRPMF